MTPSSDSPSSDLNDPSLEYNFAPPPPEKSPTTQPQLPAQPPTFDSQNVKNRPGTLRSSSKKIRASEELRFPNLNYVDEKPRGDSEVSTSILANGGDTSTSASSQSTSTANSPFTSPIESPRRDLEEEEHTKRKQTGRSRSRSKGSMRRSLSGTTTSGMNCLLRLLMFCR